MSKEKRFSSLTGDKSLSRGPEPIVTPGVAGQEMVVACAGDDVLLDPSKLVSLVSESPPPAVGTTDRKQTLHSGALSWEEPLPHFILPQGNNLEGETSSRNPFPA